MDDLTISFLSTVECTYRLSTNLFFPPTPEFHSWHFSFGEFKNPRVGRYYASRSFAMIHFLNKKIMIIINFCRIVPDVRIDFIWVFYSKKDFPLRIQYLASIGASIQRISQSEFQISQILTANHFSRFTLFDNSQSEVKPHLVLVGTFAQELYDESPIISAAAAAQRLEEKLNNTWKVQRDFERLWRTVYVLGAFFLFFNQHP